MAVPIVVPIAVGAYLGACFVGGVLLGKALDNRKFDLEQQALQDEVARVRSGFPAPKQDFTAKPM